MFGWLTDLRRKWILEHPFPESWDGLLERNITHWEHLGPDERTYLRELVQVFVAEKNWEGCGGLELTDEIRVTIAGLACLLVLGMDHVLYRNVESILVYPSTVVPPSRMSGHRGALTVEMSSVPIAGEAMLGGPVLLVWDAVKHDTVHPERGHNVVFHEFAHKLDMLDGLVDGTPPLATREQHARWVEVCTREFRELRQRSSAGQSTFLDAYGATNVGEFFAVATEQFFGRPVDMSHRHSDLYGVLREFYRQDPAMRVALCGGDASPHSSASDE